VSVGKATRFGAGGGEKDRGSGCGGLEVGSMGTVDPIGRATEGSVLVVRAVGVALGRGGMAGAGQCRGGGGSAQNWARGKDGAGE
jgi:hypothetical protein